MLEYISHHAGQAKTVFIVCMAYAAGDAATLVDEGSKHPALISAMVGGSIALLIKLVDVWYDNRKNQREARQKSVASADKVLEIETQEKRELRISMNRLRSQERLFWQEQTLNAKAESFEARSRAHRFGGEVMRLQSIILGLQNVMAGADPPLAIPTITLTEYSVLMYGTPEQQAEIAQQVREYKDQMIRDEERESEITQDAVRSDNIARRSQG
jgi:hypothetical protein